MNDQHEIQLELSELRRAIDAHEWYPCELALEKLLRRLPGRNILELLFEQLDAYLPYFESYFPQVTWFREWLTDAQQFIPIRSDIAVVQYPDADDYVEYLAHDLPSHSFSALQGSMEPLKELYNYYLDGKKPADWPYLIIHSLCGLLHVRMDAYVAQHCPDIWQARYVPELDEEAIINLDQEEREDFMHIFEAYRSCGYPYLEQLHCELASKIGALLAGST